MKRDIFKPIISAILIGLLVGYVIRESIDNKIPLEPFDQQLESIDGMTYEGPRSSEWVQVRSDFVRKHPRCEACGSTANLNVHHIEPFHQRPDLELVEDNLITLCREHHYFIGHDPDGPWKPAKPSWSKSNPLVRVHAQMVRKGLKY